MGRGGPGDSDPLLPPGAAEGFFEYRRRPKRDAAWLYAYLVVLALALAGGIFAFSHRNQQYNELLKPESLSDPKLCPLPAPNLAAGGTRRRLLVRKEGDDAAWQADKMLASSAALLGVSAAGAIGLGAVLLLLSRHHPKVVVWSALALQIIVPAAAGTAGLVGGKMAAGGVMLGVAALIAVTFWFWKEQINLVVQLLGVAGHALAANMGLLPLALGLQVVLGVLEVPLVLCALAAFMNGKLAYNDARVDHGTARFPGECVDEQQNVVPCCAWESEPWVGAYMTLAGIAATWTLFLISEIKVFVVAGSVGQWYFEPFTAAGSGSTGSALLSGSGAASSSSPSKAGGSPPPRRSRVGLSLGHALGPSIGSLCAGSAILTLISMLRNALEKAKKERNRGNLAAACALACLSFMLSLFEALTKFATVRCALTGEAFWDAGRAVTDLLRRNALDAYGVWWLPGVVMQSCCFVLSAVWAVGVFFIGRGVWAGMPDGKAAAAVVALLAFFASWAVLAFCAGMLLNVVDAVFVCFGMERDARQCARPEIHQVYCLLPTVGPIVEQPDGGMVYGQPAAGQAPPQYYYSPPQQYAVQQGGPVQYYYSAPGQHAPPPAQQGYGNTRV